VNNFVWVSIPFFISQEISYAATQYAEAGCYLETKKDKKSQNKNCDVLSFQNMYPFI
jgi:hypothetical protein